MLTFTEKHHRAQYSTAEADGDSYISAGIRAVFDFSPPVVKHNTSVFVSEHKLTNSL